MKDQTIETHFNDRTIRIVMIPFFGIVIPNIAGLIDNSLASGKRMAFEYVYLIVISLAIWHGNRYLVLRLRDRFSWLSQPIYKVLGLIVSNIFYTIPVAVGFFAMWYVFIQNTPADWIVILKATALYVVSVIFIMHSYETVFLIKSWEIDKTKGDAIEKAKAKAELEALKNQIDPHFMFNSLNTLSYLIEKQPDKARQFNDALAEVFRYILYNKDRELVLLSEEIGFAEKYFSLIKIRFGSGVILRGIPLPDLDNYLLPPISLQVLIENVIKHNEFSEKRPLTITLNLEADQLTLSNEIRKKMLDRPSSGIGLKNLSERYRLITGQTVRVEETGGIFSVRLPLLAITKHAQGSAVS